jgi:hypothetical protein
MLSAHNVFYTLFNVPRSWRNASRSSPPGSLKPQSPIHWPGHPVPVFAPPGTPRSRPAVTLTRRCSEARGTCRACALTAASNGGFRDRDVTGAVQVSVKKGRGGREGYRLDSVTGNLRLMNWQARSARDLWCLSKGGWMPEGRHRRFSGRAQPRRPGPCRGPRHCKSGPPVPALLRYLELYLGS